MHYNMYADLSTVIVTASTCAIGTVFRPVITTRDQVPQNQSSMKVKTHPKTSSLLSP